MLCFRIDLVLMSLVWTRLNFSIEGPSSQRTYAQNVILRFLYRQYHQLFIIPNRPSASAHTLNRCKWNILFSILLIFLRFLKECAICLQNLTKPSDYDLSDPGVPPADVQCVSPDILKLNKCKHLFHRICLQKMYNTGTKVTSQCSSLDSILSLTTKGLAGFGGLHSK